MVYQNRLAKEKSPYLLQHAKNPIDWYPWGEEAFQRARTEDKPIFLSIGYSTCHWCHVMAHESFEDEEVADYMNKTYVAIKVDREERPDIDSLYMKVCQMMSGHGGWPLTIVMTPEKIPFYVGTYFPREGRHHLPGIMEVLTQLQRIYHEDKNQLEDIEESVKAAFEKTVQRKSEEGLSRTVVERAYQEMGRLYDPIFGGFGTGQKFPQPQNLLFLLHYHQVMGEAEALQMVEHTVSQMVAGGIWDHIGYGFSRYTIDRRWQTPHFEKMLYDNALLLMVFTTCYQVTQEPFYREVAEQLIEFVQRELTSSKGAFYSAIDADSEGEEGKFYTWDFAEVYKLLGDEWADLFGEVHGLTPRGNFEGRNILHLPDVDLSAIAEDYQITETELEKRLEESREILFSAREKRVRPHLDDKALTSWNSLMIASLARAARIFQEPGYLNLAQSAVSFIEETLYDGDRLMARYRDEETKYLAYLDDYAFLSWAYLEMYEADYDLSYLKKAIQVTEQMQDLFWDEEDGGFFFSGKDGEALLIRDKEIAEGAMPSGNSVAALVYAKLAMLTGDTAYTDHLYELYQVFHDDVSHVPSSAPTLLESTLLSEYSEKQIVVIGSKEEESYQVFFKELNKMYLPNTVILAAESPEQFKGAADFAVAYPKIENHTTIYICENFICRQPTTDIEKALEQIREKEG